MLLYILYLPPTGEDQLYFLSIFVLLFVVSSIKNKDITYNNWRLLENSPAHFQRH